jgi:hypothetical protein
MATDRDNVITRSIQFPKSLIRRATSAGKTFHISFSQLVRDGLELRIAQLDQKLKDEEAQRLAAVEKKKSARVGIVPLRKLGEPMTKPITTPLAERVPFAPRPDESFERLIDTHAQAILDAGSDQNEMRRRAVVAVQAVKDLRPLTHPPETEILAMLETRIIRLRQSGVTPARTFDSFVGAVINPSKVRSHGDVGDDELGGAE